MQKERNLGFFETLKVLTHDNAAGNDIAVIHLCLSGPLEVELQVRAALRQIALPSSSYSWNRIRLESRQAAPLHSGRSGR